MNSEQMKVHFQWVFFLIDPNCTFICSLDIGPESRDHAILNEDT